MNSLREILRLLWRETLKSIPYGEHDLTGEEKR